jgi:hypothetical protein
VFLVVVFLTVLLELPMLFRTARRANAEPTCETFFYSDSREAFFMTWTLGEAARAAAEDAIAWVNSQIGGNVLVVNDDTRVLVAFRDRNNGRLFNESNIIFEGDAPAPIIGLMVYDNEAEGTTIVGFPYTTVDVEYKIDRKREDGVTSVHFKRKVKGVQGDLEVKARWIHLEPLTLPAQDEPGHTTAYGYFRNAAQPGFLYLVTSRCTQYILINEGTPTDNLVGKIRFWVDFSGTSHTDIDYQTIFGDPGNILFEASTFTGEEILYACY